MLVGVVSVWRWFRTKVEEPVDGATLGLFRFGFGAILCQALLVELPQAAIKYPLWEFRARPPWLEFTSQWPLLDPSLNLLGLVVTAALICVGLWTRLSAAAFCGLYWYLRLYDESLFNNHDYLICLLAGAFACIRSDAACSLRSWHRPLAQQQIPGWHLRLIVAHFCLVYWFGAVNKLNGDWLQGQPVGAWFAASSGLPVIGPWLEHPLAGTFFAYAGLLFDALIPFVLLWRPTRLIGIAGTLAFNGLNSLVFEIGPFPGLMVWANVLFLEPTAPRTAWRWLSGWWRSRSPSAAGEARVAGSNSQPVQQRTVGPAGPLALSDSHAAAALQVPRWVAPLLALYLAFHVLWPFRHLTCRGWTEWTEECKYYSWRMMLSHKETFLMVTVTDGRTGQVIVLDQRHYLTSRHERGKGVWGNPRYMAQFARFIARQARQDGLYEPVVKVQAISSLNGRPFQYLVDPEVDLGRASEPIWGTPDWVIPLAPNQPLGRYATNLSDKTRRIVELLKAHEQDPRILLESVIDQAPSAP